MNDINNKVKILSKLCFRYFQIELSCKFKQNINTHLILGLLENFGLKNIEYKTQV
ncbi:hypothetical protein pb186bvf_018153 [Paramecium bursaria]